MSSVIETAVNWIVERCNDSACGYSQSVRWGPSYDCSSLVISAFVKAGVDVKSAGASYTGNMYNAFLKCNFQDVTSLINLATGHGLQKGDVLLNKANHTALFIGNGRIAHARSSEGTSNTADDSGNEVRTQNYFNYPWDVVLRYSESGKAVNTTTGVVYQTGGKVTAAVTPKGYFTMTFKNVSRGTRGTTVKRIQQILNAEGHNCGTADGVFGAATYAALVAWQKANGVTADGIAGETTLKLMFGGE